MAGLSIQRKDRGDTTHLYLEGSLDETTVLRWDLFPGLMRELHIHLRRVTRINSCGVREWINFVSLAPPGLELVFEQCSVAFMKQLNLIANFLGRGKVGSFILPLYCPACETEVEKLVDADDPGALQGLQAHPEVCPSCQTPMELDFIPAAYFDCSRAAPPAAAPAPSSLRSTIEVLFSGTLTPTALCDRAERFLFTNAAWVALFRLEHLPLEEQRLAALVELDLSGAPLRPIERAAEERQPLRWREVRSPQLPDGNLLVEVTPFLDDDSYLLQITDLGLEAQLQQRYRELWETERESRLSLARKNLELEEVRRSLESTLGELRRAQSAMVLAERLASLGQLAGALAHELNNPAAYVLNNLVELERLLAPLGELRGALDRGGPTTHLLDQLARPELRDLLGGHGDVLGDALEGARLIVRIARDLKVFMNGETEEPHPCDVHAILESALRLAQNELRHRAQVVRDLGEVPRALGSENRLVQVFLNLLLNAAQAIPLGRTDGVVRVITGQVERSVSITIADNGVGMSEELRQRIFEPFFTTRSAGEGSGLGLALTYKIVRDLGGTVVVRSVPGQGTEVQVLLPQAPRPERPGPDGDHPSGAPGAAAGKPRPRVLLVDDDHFVRQSFGRLLQRLFEVTLVGGGIEALKVLGRGERFDVILVDLMMPEMSGMQLIQAIERLHPDAPHALAILSGGAFQEDLRAFQNGGRYPVIAKAQEPAGLLRAVRELAGC